MFKGIPWDPLENINKSVAGKNHSTNALKISMLRHHKHVSGFHCKQFWRHPC